MNIQAIITIVSLETEEVIEDRKYEEKGNLSINSKLHSLSSKVRRFMSVNWEENPVINTKETAVRVSYSVIPE